MKIRAQEGSRVGIYDQTIFYSFDGFEYYCNDSRFSPPTKANSQTPLFLKYIKRKV